MAGIVQCATYLTGRLGQCKECIHTRNRQEKYVERVKKSVSAEYERIRLRKPMRIYGISKEEYFNLIEKYPCCAICGKPPVKKALSIDHNHKTGKVRGLLCHSCNMGIGLLNEDTGIMYKTIQYINEHNL